MIDNGFGFISLFMLGEIGVYGFIGLGVALLLLYLFDEAIDDFLKKWNII